MTTKQAPYIRLVSINGRSVRSAKRRSMGTNVESGACMSGLLREFIGTLNAATDAGQLEITVDDKGHIKLKFLERSLARDG